jgi:hypothetical protein
MSALKYSQRNLFSSGSKKINTFNKNKPGQQIIKETSIPCAYFGKNVKLRVKKRLFAKEFHIIYVTALSSSRGKHNSFSVGCTH